MDRVACVELPAFPLQILLRQHPDWHGQPVAVVDRDHPQGVILWLNDIAQSARLTTGLRYATARSLHGDLRAAEVPGSDIERALSILTRRLATHSPNVERSDQEPGVFWLDASGLEPLYPSLADWAQGIETDLAGLGYRATVVVGYERFATYALARSKPGRWILNAPADEQAALNQVPLARLAVEPRTRDALAKLGVFRIGQFRRLPPDGIRQRYGAAALDLYQMAGGERRRPVQPDRATPPLSHRLFLDQAEIDAERLIALIEQTLSALIDERIGPGHAIDELRLVLRFERLGLHRERLCPAAPTRDLKQLMELMRLRLSGRQLPDGVEELRLVVHTRPIEPQPLDWLDERPRRDLDAANRALARLRAAFGEQAVAQARLGTGHLPENSFSWAPLSQLAPARPGRVLRPHLIRRVYRRPIPLPPRPRHEPDGWMLHGLEQGPVVRVAGPYIIAGGWWVRPVHREYQFAETKTGEILWVFYDRVRRRWFVHGRLE